MQISEVYAGTYTFEEFWRVCEESCRPAAAGGEASNHAAFIRSVADLLRGDYKRSEYGKVMLPLTVLRRLEASDWC